MRRHPRKRASNDRGGWWHFFDIFEWEGVLWLAVIVAVITFMIFVGLPLILFVLDSLLLILVTVTGIAARLLFRRPWVIEARAGDVVQRWQVVGWRASARRLENVERYIKSGWALPKDFPATPIG